jgi:hypothetical protein
VAEKGGCKESPWRGMGAVARGEDRGDGTDGCRRRRAGGQAGGGPEREEGPNVDEEGKQPGEEGRGKWGGDGRKGGGWR